MFYWSPQMITFMKDASEQSTYHDYLVDKFSKYISPTNHVCDAGCGLGYLSLALSKKCKSVTSVDMSQQSLSVLHENISRHNIKNINIIEGDVSKHPPNMPYDAMVFCFFGNAQQIINIAKSQCRGNIIIISKNYDSHKFSLSKQPIKRFTFNETKENLKSFGVSYSECTFAPEMGQPFRSAYDAVEFFRIYSKDPNPKSIKKEDIIGKLIHNPSDEFPYYLPFKKQMGMIVFNTNDLPEN